MVECRFVDGPKAGRTELVEPAHSDGRLPSTIHVEGGSYTLYAGHTWDGYYRYTHPEYRFFPS